MFKVLEFRFPCLGSWDTDTDIRVYVYNSDDDDDGGGDDDDDDGDDDADHQDGDDDHHDDDDDHDDHDDDGAGDDDHHDDCLIGFSWCLAGKCGMLTTSQVAQLLKPAADDVFYLAFLGRFLGLQGLEVQVCSGFKVFKGSTALSIKPREPPQGPGLRLILIMIVVIVVIIVNDSKNRNKSEYIGLVDFHQPWFPQTTRNLNGVIWGYWKMTWKLLFRA